MPPLSALFGSTPDSSKQILDAIESQFELSSDALVAITTQFLDDFRLGLGEYNHPMAMIPTFVTGVPTGEETGTFLALDLGGTNLRVCEVQLKGNHEFSLRQQKYKVSDALKTGEATALFDYLAASVDAFLTEPAPSPTNVIQNPFSSSSSALNNQVDQDNEPALPLGLTFSFPVEQTAIDEGKILTWTKGFSARNAIGHDVVKLLQDAFDRKHMHVKCVALVNDTVGALLSRAYTAGGCVLGAIFGTGTNGAYVEKVSNLTKLGDSPARQNGGDMVVNCEWGAFNNTRTVLPMTPFDNKLDRESINPRLQAFEKFISGMYLGEITRNVLLSLIDASPKPLLFNGKASAELNHHYGLDTAITSEIESIWTKNRQSPGSDNEVAGASAINCVDVPQASIHATSESELSEDEKSRLKQIQVKLVDKLSLSPEDVSLRDAAIVRWASSLVANRAAKLAACAVATVLVQTERAKLGGGSPPSNEQIVVGVDGSLIEHYPNFNTNLRAALRSLVGEEVEARVDIGMAKDGSGVGAALCALMATKQGH